MQDPELVVDVAHNPDGVRAMLDAWEAVRAPAATHVVFGVTASKDYRSIVEMLARAGVASLTVVQANTPDACPLPEVQSAAREAGLDVLSGASVVDGVRSALRRALDAGAGSVLLFGSHYVVGELLTSMEKIDLLP
jgi:folylpolyglutamate synthase/dihydropteroate synthase